MNPTKQRSTRYQHERLLDPPSEPTTDGPRPWRLAAALFGLVTLLPGTAQAQAPPAEAPATATSDTAPGTPTPVPVLAAGARAPDPVWHMPAPSTQPAPAPQGGTYPPPPAWRGPPPSAVPPGPAGPAPPGPDAAEAPAEPSAPFFDLALATHVPLSIGGAATLELPGRLLLQVDLGWMPPAYASAINSMVKGFGAYDGGVATLVDGALEDAMVVRASGGWRPFPSAGFELTGGYTYVALSGSVSPTDLAEVVAGTFASEIAQQLEQDITLDSQLHNVHVALGWRWVAFDHLVIRANLGYTQTLASSSSVEIPEHREGQALANPIVDAELDDIYRQYVKLPVFSVGAGYRF